MNINIKLQKNFTSQYNRLQEEYGSEIARLNGFDDDQLSYTDFIDNFVDKQNNVADASIDSNANVGHKDVVSLEREMPKPHSKLLAFNKIHYDMQKLFGFRIANEWLRMEWEGKLYLHDAPSSSLRPYCFAYDLKDLAEKGLYFISGQNPRPAKHLTTFVDFVKEFVSFACNRTSGAVGLPNLIPYMYYFWKKDVDSDYLGIKTSHNERYYADQAFQRFIYAVNQPYVRDGSQSAFTNTSVFDHPYFEALFGGATFPDGTFMIDYEDEILEFQKWYLKVMAQIRNENMFTFPVSSISLLRQKGSFVDEDFAKWSVKHNMKWSDSNMFIDSSVNSLSNCCRLKSSLKIIEKFRTIEDLENEVLKEMYPNSNESIESLKQIVNQDTKLHNKFKELLRDKQVDQNESLGHVSSIGGSGLKVGSVKVSTINLARLALDTSSEGEYLDELEHRVEIDLSALHAVRYIIRRNVEKGMLPNFSFGLIDFDHLYNTIGFIGIYETMKKFGYTKLDGLGNTYYKEEAYEFGKKIFDTIRKASNKFKREHNCDYQINIEQIPGESAAAKLMQKDKFFYPKANIYDLPLYGNQFIPLGIKTTLQERIKVASQFDSFCNGGSILHVNIDAPFDSFDKAWKMTNYIADQGVTYFAFNTKIQACEDNHAFYGTKCSVCHKPAAKEFTRIVGFYVPTNTWSKARKAEYAMRKWESVEKELA